MPYLFFFNNSSKNDEQLNKDNPGEAGGVDIIVHGCIFKANNPQQRSNSWYSLQHSIAY